MISAPQTLKGKILTVLLSVRFAVLILQIRKLRCGKIPVQKSRTVCPQHLESEYPQAMILSGLSPLDFQVLEEEVGGRCESPPKLPGHVHMTLRDRLFLKNTGEAERLLCRHHHRKHEDHHPPSCPSGFTAPSFCKTPIHTPTDTRSARHQSPQFPRPSRSHPLSPHFPQTHLQAHVAPHMCTL